MLKRIVRRIKWILERKEVRVFLTIDDLLGYSGLKKLFFWFRSLFPVARTVRKTDKFGVLFVVDFGYINYGDDIQALAQIEALKRLGIDSFIKVDREQLGAYRGAPVNLLMGGWYIHNFETLPPAPRINPICTSIHVTHPYAISKCWAFWKANEPIGCRDLYTVGQFESHSIKAYLSKCLTLTFDRYAGEREGIYIVDLQSSSFRKTLPPDLPVTREIGHYTKSLVEQFSVDDHSLDVAAGYLELYKRAELIITSRLHCALPARAFGTPVIFVHEDYRADTRFSGLEKELNGSDGTVPFGELDPHIDYGVVQETKDRFADDLKNRIARLRG